MEKVLIKLGGSSLNEPETLKQLISLVKSFLIANKKIVIVHGGGPAINAALESKAITWKFINGQRQTTPEMMTVIEEVLAKNVNNMIVQILQANGVNAVGVSGAQNQMLLCSQLSEELMQVGKIEEINVEEILHQFQAVPSQISVIAPIGTDLTQKKYNINADWAASKIATALKVDELIFLTDQSGILDSNKKLLPTLSEEEINNLISNGVISGGMFTKVNTMLFALKNGVQKVRVLKASEASRLLLNQDCGSVISLQTSAVKKDATKWTQQTI